MTKEELAQRVGKTRQTILKIEEDPNDAITVSLLRKIADVLDVSVLDFLHEYPGENRHIFLDSSYDSIVKSMRMLFGRSDKYYKGLSKDERQLTRILGLVAMEFFKQQQKEMNFLRMSDEKNEVYSPSQEE